MNSLRTLLCTGITLVVMQQQAPNPNPADKPIMVIAVSRDSSVLEGGISSSFMMSPGRVKVEPIATVSASGEWASLPCSVAHQAGCRNFQMTYLKQAHMYAVISSAGYGANVYAPPITLSECNSFTGDGRSTGAPFQRTAIAASDPDAFPAGPEIVALRGNELRAVRNQLAAFIPIKLDSTQSLRIFGVQLEGRQVVIIQRRFADLPHDVERSKRIFAVGTLNQNHFRPTIWQHQEDDNEQVLGAIHLKSGRDFLITTVSDPESQTFRIYGIQDGHVALVYQGGGSSC